MGKSSQFKEFLTEDLIEFIEGIQFSFEDYYELCRTYAQILINAKTIIDKGCLCGIFGYKDSDYFISKFNNRTNSLLSREVKEKLFDSINDVFYNTLTDEEKEKLLMV